MPHDNLVVTSADANYFNLAQGCILSVREKLKGRQLKLAFLDVGCTAEQHAWLRANVDDIRRAEWEFTFPGRDQLPNYFKSLLARPLLRRYFPGHETYMWIDADAWVQDWRAVELFFQGARRRQGLAIVPEIDRASRLQYGRLPAVWNEVHQWYATAYGPDIAAQFHSFPILNAGVFALHREAPHWAIWQESLTQALRNTCTVITDQLALNLTVYHRGLLAQTELLPAWCNWTCHVGLPSWDEQGSRLVEPYLPHTTIGIMHLTGLKHRHARLATTEGRELDVLLRYPARPLQTAQAPISPAPEVEETDYISPGFESVHPDRFFPNMIVGNKALCNWPFLRRQIPHHWYVDRRAPNLGFLSRDEAHILYNTALGFRDHRALEIGCWMGWSACHLALAGVLLNVVDPILEQREFHDSVAESLQAAGVADSVNLVAGKSPEAVRHLAALTNRKWSLFFIDGDHQSPHPLQDAMACEESAANDALMLFHDLVCPDVAKAMDYLQDKGWHTMVYQTMQLMGVAWRGNVKPVGHLVDPRIQEAVPSDLARHHVCKGV